MLCRWAAHLPSAGVRPAGLGCLCGWVPSGKNTGKCKKGKKGKKGKKCKKCKKRLALSPTPLKMRFTAQGSPARFDREALFGQVKKVKKLR